MNLDSRLKIISEPFHKSGKELWVTCSCTCGVIKDYRKRDVLRKRSRSCGCLHKERAAIGSVRCAKYNGEESAMNNLYQSYKGNAKERELEFQLSKEEFKFITQQDCHYCGKPPSNVRLSKSTKAGLYMFNGIDRVDNMEGYLSTNVVACCEDCNYMKRNMTYGDFMDKCRLIASKHR